MDVENSGGPDLLPEHWPDLKHVGPRFTEPSFQSHFERLDELAQRFVLWTLAIEDSFDELEAAAQVPGFRHATIGFADPEHEADAFGVLIYTTPGSTTDRAQQPAQDDGPGVWVGDVHFPVIVRSSYDMLHAPPYLHPRTGTSTCWAESYRVNERRGSELVLLTAKHVIPGYNNSRGWGHTFAIGDRVPLTTGHAELVDLAPDGIDGALLAPLDGVMFAGNELDTLPLVAQWMDVTCYGQHRTWNTKVTEVSPQRSMHPMFQQRIVIAQPGTPGDSGALIVDSDGRGVAMYLGAVAHPATNQMEGFGQPLSQVTHLLKLRLLI